MTEPEKSLLELMLDDSEKQQPPIRQKTDEVSVEKEEKESWPQNHSQLLELSDKEMRVWLSRVAPNDLLVLVKVENEVFRSRVMSLLTEDSILWLKNNLEYLDSITGNFEKASRQASLDVARKLIESGLISVPEGPKNETKKEDTSIHTQQSELIQTLVQLVALVHQKGKGSLMEFAQDVEHPLLDFGLQSIIKGMEREELKKEIDKQKRVLEEAYRTELKLIGETILALDGEEDPHSLTQKLKNVLNPNPAELV